MLYGEAWAEWVIPCSTLVWSLPIVLSEREKEGSYEKEKNHDFYGIGLPRADAGRC